MTADVLDSDVRHFLDVLEKKFKTSVAISLAELDMFGIRTDWRVKGRAANIGRCKYEIAR